MADVTLSHRQPTIRIPRVPAEPGATIALYWNGSIAQNGDGIPGGDVPISYAAMLPRETGWNGPIPYWLRGMPHIFGGGYGLGGFGEPAADFGPNMGFGGGPYGVGAFGIGGGYWEWTAANQWRNGIYLVAARIRDWLGNEQQTPIAELSIEIAALPRPCARSWIISFTDDLLTAGWHPSPEFV